VLSRTPAFVVEVIEMSWFGRSVRQIGKWGVSAQNYSSAFGDSCEVLLIFAAVMLDLMEGMFELARFKRIELGFGFADFTDKCLEVGRLGVALDKGGKSEFLNWHRVPPAASIAKVQSSVRNCWRAAVKGCGKRTRRTLRIDLEEVATVPVT
jgi:hypothetical protein